MNVTDKLKLEINCSEFKATHRFRYDLKPLLDNDDLKRSRAVHALDSDHFDV
jgi:hypothetical protein